MTKPLRFDDEAAEKPGWTAIEAGSTVAPMRSIIAVVCSLVGACGSTRSPPAQAPVPGSAPTVVAPRPTAAPPTAPAAPATPARPAGPVVRLDKTGVLVDGKPITSPADLPKEAQALIVSAAGTVAIRDVVEYLFALPVHAELVLEVSGGSQALPAGVLADRRCVSFLAATGATIADVARVAASAPAGDRHWYLSDSRACGASAAVRLGALREGQGSVYVRSGVEPRCHRLTYDPKGALVRAGDSGGHPQLAFQLAISDDAVGLSGPLAAGTPAVAVVQCRGKYTLKGDNATAILLARLQPNVYGPPVAREVPVFYTEQDCLAAAAPADSTSDCLRNVLDATSTLPDAVVDRVTPIRKRRGKLYALRAGTCAPFDLHPPRKKGYNAVYQDSITYTGHSLLHSWVELGAPGVGSGELHQALYPVVQTKDDHVIVGSERWYLNEVACRKAAKAKRAK